MKKQPGYFVWNPDRSFPSVRHQTLVDAVVEAERLAQANPGMEFYVMAAFSCVVAPKPKIRQLRVNSPGVGDVKSSEIGDSIPF